jgi:hypothetical protein
MASNLLEDATRLSWELAVPAQVHCAVFDVRGRCLRTLLDAHQMAGRHELVWRGAGHAGQRLPTGVYFIRLQTDGASRVQRIMIR